MGIVGDNCDEREIRVDRMIDEFRNAQLRRRAKATAVKGEDQVVESQRGAHADAAVAGSTPTRTSHEND
jgi:hypothetical protein